MQAVAPTRALKKPLVHRLHVVAPGETEVASEADADAALAEAMTRLPPGEAAAEVSKALNLPRKPLYKRALEMQGR